MSRLERLKNILSDIDAVLVTSKANIFYLSNFTSEDARLIITKNENILITDSRYTIQAKKQATDFEIIDTPSDFVDVIKKLNIKTLGIEDKKLTLSSYNKLIEELEGIELVCLGERIDELRQIKDEEEINKIRCAAKIADEAFVHILDYIKPDKTELQVSLELEMFMRKNGATNVSFETIVASGVRSAMPHGVASNKQIEKGDLVTLDYGCVFEGYSSDMTRTIGIGKVSGDKREIYQLVKTAQRMARDAIEVGKSCSEVDAVARDYITSVGYGDYFRHGLGHSVGIEIHENPTFSPKCETILAQNMIITVEPGIYIEGEFGVRIEDLICVKEGKNEKFTKVTKDLLII